MNPWVETGLEAECAELAHAHEGERNTAGFKVAVRFLGFCKGGHADHVEVGCQVRTALVAAGLDDREIKTILESAYSRAEPADPPELAHPPALRVVEQAPIPTDDDAPPEAYSDGAPSDSQYTAPAQPAPGLLCAADVTPRRVRWLWDGHIPRGKITVLAGLPGVGKTTIALSVGAMVSTGTQIPLSNTEPVEGGICIVSTEDDADDTIVPRLVTAGADLSKCWIWPDSLPIPSLPDEADVLAAQLERHHCRLLIIDPLSVILSGTVDAHKDADVRRCLAALRKLARQCDCAILGIGHLNKSNHGGALHRIGGSGAWVAAARSVLLVSADPDGNQDEMVVAVAKVSSARRPSALRLERVDDNGIVLIDWVEECDLEADELVAAQPTKGPAPEARTEAEAWLASFLAPGPQWASDGYDEADAEGISKRTLQRARSSLGVKVTKDTTGKWVWSAKHSATRTPQ